MKATFLTKKIGKDESRSIQKSGDPAAAFFCMDVNPGKRAQEQ